MKIKLFALALLVAELCGAEDLVARFAKVLPEAIRSTGAVNK